MRRSIIFYVVLSIIFFRGCDGDFFFTKHEIIYDPGKAGATIVKCFIITGQTLSFNDGKIVVDNIDIALYGDNIYIHTGDKVLYVFEKINFTKTCEIDLNIIEPVGGFNYRRGGLAVFDEGYGFLLCNTKDHPYGTFLLSLDLKTGATVEIEGLEENGIEPNSWISGIGYDKENDLVWFNVPPTSDPSDMDNLYFLEYDSSERILTLKTKIEQLPLPHTSIYYRTGLFISGDNLFRTGYRPALHPGSPYNTNIGVEKYLISNPEERQYYIDTEYLGTETIPNNIIYDEPYIWMLVERDNQIQMLKLLPNE